MRIDIKDKSGKPRLTVHVDPAHPPTVVHDSDPRGPAVSLNWDRALDDTQHLRHCPVCGCRDLYLRNTLPQVTGFVLILMAGVVSMVLLGVGRIDYALLVLGVVLLVDVVIFLTTSQLLVCYQCASEFRDLPTRGRHGRWSAEIAERYDSQPSHPRAKAADPAEAQDDDADHANGHGQTDHPDHGERQGDDDKPQGANR